MLEKFPMIAGLKPASTIAKGHRVVFHSLMPTNLYGPGDNYHPQNSHLLPAPIRALSTKPRNPEPRVVAIWGTGMQEAGPMHVDDLGRAIIHCLQIEDPPNLANVGTSVDQRIIEIAEMVKAVVGFQGGIETGLQ